MKEQFKIIKEDINIIIEAIEQGDVSDAIKMLADLREDLGILELMC